MSKKDYELIAAVLKARMDWAVGDDPEMVAVRYAVTGIASQFAAKLMTTNPRFDRVRFLRACGVDA